MSQSSGKTFLLSRSSSNMSSSMTVRNFDINAWGANPVLVRSSASSRSATASNASTISELIASSTTRVTRVVERFELFVCSTVFKPTCIHCYHLQSLIADFSLNPSPRRCGFSCNFHSKRDAFVYIFLNLFF